LATLGENHSGQNTQIMLKILEVTFPFFALVLAGYVAAYRRWLSLEAIPGLNAFVLFFALPAMLYQFGAKTPIRELLDLPLFLVYFACAMTMVSFTLAVTLSRRIRWNDGALGALVAAFPNTGFMGVPLLVALLGAQAAGPAIVTITCDMIITTSLCVGLSRLDDANGQGAWRAFQMALKGVFSNPMPWAIVLGALASANGFTLPSMLDTTIGLLAQAASPVALFTIGTVLARSVLQTKADRAHHVPWQDYVPVALLKLILHPLLVMLAMLIARRLGAPIDMFAITVVVLVASLPSASNVSMLAERMGANNGRIARIILVSTILAFPTFSLMVKLLRP
jgi:malonate transporter and related proteins